MKRIGILLAVLVWVWLEASCAYATDRAASALTSMAIRINDNDPAVDMLGDETDVIEHAPLGSTSHANYACAIVVSFSDFTLYVFDRDGDIMFAAPVALPRQTPNLPVEGKLVSIERRPWWFPPPGVRAYTLKKEGKVLPKKVPPGPNNPMGPVKLSFDWRTPGAEKLSKVHGTNHPNSIGKRASSGCIRLHNEDALALADILQPLFDSGGVIAISYVKDLEDDDGAQEVAISRQ